MNENKEKYMKITVTGIHHIMITVGDIEKAKEFYNKILGFEEMVIPNGIEGPRAWYKLGSTELHVNEHSKYQAGNSHFAISVGESQYKSYIAHIETSGYEKKSNCERYVDGYYRLYIHDPFGNCIEIINAKFK